MLFGRKEQELCYTRKVENAFFLVCGNRVNDEPIGGNKMTNYQHILVAVDGSEQSLQAFQEAIAIAKRNQACLTIASIINDVELTTSAYGYGKVFAQEKSLAEKRVIALIQEASAHRIHEIKPYVAVGNPKALLVRYAKEKQVDLLVIGATGKGAIQRVLVGSTTSYLVNHAPCQVLVVK